MLKYVIVPLLTVLVVWAWKIFSWVWLEPRKMERFLRKQGLKGNSYRFLVGDSIEISDMYKEANSKPLDLLDDITPRVMPFIEKTVRTYGTNAFAWIGPTVRIIISEPELMREVLHKHNVYHKSFGSNNISSLVFGGLGNIEGDKWSKSRMKLNPAFHMEKLKEMVPTMQSCAENILNQWNDKISEDGFGVVDVFHYVEDYSGSVVIHSLYHTDFTEEIRRVFHHLTEITNMTNTHFKPFKFPGSEYLPTREKKRAKEINNKVRRTLTNMIDERLKQRRAGERDGDLDLFDMILAELYEEDEKNLSNRERKRIINEAIGHTRSFYFAGIDTSSNLVVWTMIMLAIHHEWQVRAREEVFQVLGDDSTLTYESLSQLKVVNMILHEVLRLYSPVMELSRVVEQETQLGKLRLPKGALLQLPVALLHRRPDIWGKDALDFRPDRFAEGVLKAANGQTAFMPFGSGPRICIGNNFALMEGKAFIAQLLRTFTFELGPTYEHTPYASFFIQPQHGAPMLLRKLHK